jgi:hypothetical protein
MREKAIANTKFAFNDPYRKEKGQALLPAQYF